MRLARKLHLFFGVFFAPSIIFFAVSGFFQSFGWHEEHDGKPPMRWVAVISEVHKDQRLAAPPAQPGGESRPVQPPAGTVATQQTPTPATTPSAAPANAGSAPANVQAAATPAKAAGPPRPRRKKSFPLQVFMGFMAVGLIGSSLVGIWMGFQVNRNTPLVLGLLLAGTLIPIVAFYVGVQP